MGEAGKRKARPHEARAQAKTAAEWYAQLNDARHRFLDLERQANTRQKEVGSAEPIWHAGLDAVYDNLIDQCVVEYNREVRAISGLIASGREAMPFGLEMMRNKDAWVREQGAEVLGGLGRDADVVNELVAALEDESEDQVIDSIVVALGVMRSRGAVPALAKLLRDPATDGDTRWEAALALGRIVRKRFDRQDDPIGAALDWLNSSDLGVEP